jgi:hypothetical protein
MADEKLTVGALLVGLALGGVGGVALDPAKEAALADITVAEMVAAKLDSTAQRIEAADKVREAGRETVYDIKSAEIAEDGKILAPAETLSVKEVDIPRAIIRPEFTFRLDVPEGTQRVRAVIFADEKGIGEWATEITEQPDASKILRIECPVRLFDQIR